MIETFGQIVKKARPDAIVEVDDAADEYRVADELSEPIARLVSAAPQMLEALKSVLWAEAVHVDLAHVRAAIAEAEGEGEEERSW